jgi:peptidoglycan/xylan/chitin deacetylase (PgdA/CDA1 family)
MLFSTVITLSLAALAAALPKKRAPFQVINSCTVPNTAALTFDDGPYVYLYDISKALVAAGAKGTFFFNGNNYGCIYTEDNAKRVKYAYDKGHQIASHTWSHANLSSLSWDQLHNEFWRVEEAFQKIVGVTPAFMRPPYGAYNELVKAVADLRHQDLVVWDFDSGDSVGATTAQSKASYDQLIAQHPSTILALNHEVYQQTAQVIVPYVIQKLQAAGYKLVTVAECVGLPAYQGPAVAPSARDATWTC